MYLCVCIYFLKCRDNLKCIKVCVCLGERESEREREICCSVSHTDSERVCMSLLCCQTDPRSQISHQSHPANAVLCGPAEIPGKCRLRRQSVEEVGGRGNRTLCSTVEIDDEGARGSPELSRHVRSKPNADTLSRVRL